MKTNSSLHWKILPLLFVVFIMACASLSSPTESFPTSGVTATDVPTIASGTGPRCTVLRDLNLRSGPGTAYNPPITLLPANTELIPLAYNPVGYPGGSWVQVEAPSQKTGWVSAGAAYISCNIDLKGLPSVSVAPPPATTTQQTARPSGQASNPSGTCGSDPGATYDCKVVFTDGFPMQFVLLKNGKEIGKKDGVQSVDFKVQQGDNPDPIYQNSEAEAAYCIFGGNGPCNSWVLEDNVYKWRSGGPPIKAGDYKVSIDATVNTKEGDTLSFHWDANVTISLP